MLLSSIRLKNILSFRDASLKLRPLNVLIGPNGVGKSNLIEVVGLLKAAPTDLNRSLAGGVQEWLSKLRDAPSVAEIEYVTGLKRATENCKKGVYQKREHAPHILRTYQTRTGEGGVSPLPPDLRHSSGKTLASQVTSVKDA